MIIEIDQSNKIEHADLLDKIHVLRHEVFVEELRWDGVQSIDGREYDEFDTSDATYLALVDDNGELNGTIRLHRYSGPTLMAKVFPHLVQFLPMPTAHDVMDMTRFVVSPRIGKDRLAKAGWDIMDETGNYARRNGVRASTCVMTTYFLKNTLKGGLDARPMGFPVGQGRDEFLAVWTPVYPRSRHQGLLNPQLIEAFENPIAA